VLYRGFEDQLEEGVLPLLLLLLLLLLSRRNNLRHVLLRPRGVRDERVRA